LKKEDNSNMKIKKLKTFGIGICIIIILGSVGMVIWSILSTRDSQGIALAALESSSEVNVSQEKLIVFEPKENSDIGIIFYPGGLVEPSAYAPVLHKIAKEGILVIITPMPLNLAIFNTNAANDVIDHFPNISTWIIAGHSLGGAAAGIYAENNPEKINSVVFWDSYPADSADLSDNTISVLSIFGTINGIPNTDNFDEQRHLLPDDAVFIGIEGASHAQFGDYGLQEGDVSATISIDSQHEIVADAMLAFINQ
jgi:hypothetical protein